MDANEMTFNDMPLMIGKMFKKIEHVEEMLNAMRKELDQKQQTTAEHTPMTLEEACAFLRMKKSTMYYKLNRGEIPATKNGKYYIMYKDELVKWTESGRVNGIPLSLEEQNEAYRRSLKRGKNRQQK